MAQKTLVQFTPEGKNVVVTLVSRTERQRVARAQRASGVLPTYRIVLSRSTIDLLGVLGGADLAALWYGSTVRRLVNVDVVNSLLLEENADEDS
jgi:hypothetical protein